MSDHASKERLEAYARKGLAPAELLAIDDHLAACDACRSALAGVSAAEAGASLAAAVEPVEPSEHIDEDALAALLEGRLDDVELELAASHLDQCPRCRDEADALLEARRDLRPQHTYQPAPRLRMVDRVAARAPALLRMAAALAVVGLGAWWALRPSGPETVRREVSPPVARPAQVQIVDGTGRVTVSEQGRVSGLDAPPAVVARVEAALGSGRLAVGEVADLGGAHGALMGESPTPGGFALVSPVGAVVESARPRLRWAELPGASVYEVTILGLDLVPVVTSQAVHGAEWTPPADLPRGRTYVWQVVALKAGTRVIAPAPPAPEARFHVLDAVRAQALDEARRRASSHLALAVLLADAGLVEDSRRELLALRAQNPGSDVVQSWLESLPQLPSPITTKPAQ